MTDTEWYEIVEVGDSSLRQCDILKALPVITPIAGDADLEEGVLPAEEIVIDAIILTQTCDLEREETQSILVAGIEPWSKVVSDNNWKSDQRRSMRKLVQQGQIVHLALLPPNLVPPEIEWSVVAFRNVYTVPKSSVEKHVVLQGLRLRMTPPHRELISQAFGMTFMRVAVVDDLARFKTEGA